MYSSVTEVSSHFPKVSGRNEFKLFYKLCRGCFGEPNLLHSLSLDLADNTSTLDGKTRCRNRKFLYIPNGGSQTWFLKNPKSSNFGKIFLSCFSALKIDPENRNFDIFRPRIFRKIAKTNSKLYCGQTTRENENFEKLIFSSESA